MSDGKRILVIGELDPKGGLTSLSEEMVGGAGKLAGEIGGGVDLFIVTAGNDSPQWDAICRGADKIYAVSNPKITLFDTEAIVAIAAEVCKKAGPALCLIGQTDLGRDVAPRLAARLNAGLCMDCTEVVYEAAQTRFVQTRPVYGGKAMASYASKAGTMQIDTIRPKSMAPLEAGVKRAGEKITVTDEAPAGKVKLLNCEKSREEGIRLEEAKVIVAGGGGLGGPDGFKVLSELAGVLDGAVGATRVPVDEKWVEHHMEIGQTGKIVSPDLYIAVGISGATQHITGILSSGKIVAINKDPDANIFRVSDYGLVADYKDALPVIIQKLKTKAA